jgi:hypothetical protein
MNRTVWSTASQEAMQWRTPSKRCQVVNSLHRGVRAWGLVVGLLACAAAQAIPVRFNFSVDFVDGPIAGQTAFGSFEVSSDDCVSFVCSGLFTPSGPDNFIGPTGTLLNFRIVVDGVAFSESSDDGYPDFPIVTLANNLLTRIDFMDFGPPSLSIFGGPGDGGGSYTNANFDTSNIGSMQQIGGAQPIPEPATALLMAGALAAGLATSRRRNVR